MCIRRQLSSLVLAASASGLFWGGSQPAVAQVARYEPQTPTLSPWLNLDRFNGGGLPNYFALVRPQIRQRQINLQEQARIGFQERQIIQLENKVQRGLQPAAPTGSNSWFMIPGNQARFLDTSQFYPQPSIRRR